MWFKKKKEEKKQSQTKVAEKPVAKPVEEKSATKTKSTTATPSKTVAQKTVAPAKAEASKNTKAPSATKKSATTKKSPTKTETKSATAKKSIYRVVYDKEARVWVIKKDGAKRNIASFATKDEALSRVKELSESQDLNFVVHKKDGKFQKK